MLTQSQDTGVFHRIIKTDGLIAGLPSKLRYSHLCSGLTLGLSSAAGLLDNRSVVDGAGVLLCLLPLLFKLVAGLEQNFAQNLSSPSFIKELGGDKFENRKGHLSKVSCASGCGDFINFITLTFNSTEYNLIVITACNFKGAGVDHTILKV